MARRPVFLPSINSPWVRRELVEFLWHPGLAISQKEKSVTSLHAAARSQLQLTTILEISSKSKDVAGIALSAFNLMIQLPNGHLTSVECAYQGSKKFVGGGPFVDIYARSSIDAKRDERLRGATGALVAFEFFGRLWPLEPESLFYDWLYLSALCQPQNQALVSVLLKNQAFTDIEFNPEKSISCQANSAALFLGLKESGLGPSNVVDPEYFQALFTVAPRPDLSRQSALF